MYTLGHMNDVKECLQTSYYRCKTGKFSDCINAKQL
jgi:hypothetical protein